MKVYVRFTAFAFSALFFSFAYAASTINIFFANNTPFEFTIKPSAANYCIDELDTDSFAVSPKEKRTYYATLQDNCAIANITFDYSQTFNPQSAEFSRAINGTLTYQQFKQYGTWKAKLNMDLTPPVPSPRPVIFRTTCGESSLFCASAAVTLTSNNFFASFTVIPEGVSWGFGALAR